MMNIHHTQMYYWTFFCGFYMCTLFKFILLFFFFPRMYKIFFIFLHIKMSLWILDPHCQSTQRMEPKPHEKHVLVTNEVCKVKHQTINRFFERRRRKRRRRFWEYVTNWCGIYESITWKKNICNKLLDSSSFVHKIHRIGERRKEKKSRELYWYLYSQTIIILKLFLLALFLVESYAGVELLSAAPLRALHPLLLIYGGGRLLVDNIILATIAMPKVFSFSFFFY